MADEPAKAPSHQNRRWTEHFAAIDREIAQSALLCRIRLLDPGVIERVLNNDTLVCGTNNPRAFDKLRQLLILHYTVRDRAVATLGEEQMQQMRRELLERLRKRVGDRLGGSPD